MLSKKGLYFSNLSIINYYLSKKPIYIYLPQSIHKAKFVFTMHYVVGILFKKLSTYSYTAHVHCCHCTHTLHIHTHSKSTILHIEIVQIENVEIKVNLTCTLSLIIYFNCNKINTLTVLVNTRYNLYYWLLSNIK